MYCTVEQIPSASGVSHQWRTRHEAAEAVASVNKMGVALQKFCWMYQLVDNRKDRAFLSGLALLHIHRDVTVSRENVIRRFDCTGHRRLGQLLL